MATVALARNFGSAQRDDNDVRLAVPAGAGPPGHDSLYGSRSRRPRPRLFASDCPLRERFAGKYVYAVYTILSSCPLLGRTTEAIKSCSDTNLLQTNLGQIWNDLCLRQSACNSTCPQINVSEGLLREFNI